MHVFYDDFPHPYPGHPWWGVVPLDASERQMAVLAEGIRTSELRPQGPSFGLCSSPQLTCSTSSGTEQAPEPGLS